MSETDKQQLNALGETIRKLRNARGMSQTDLAERTNLHRTYISSIERGERNASYLNLLKLAAGLGMSLSEMLDS